LGSDCIWKIGCYTNFIVLFWNDYVSEKSFQRRRRRRRGKMKRREES
jgi:hypothetical protein